MHKPTMDRLVIILSALLLVTSFLADTVLSENDMEPMSHSKRKLLWFGTRLGRKKRNPRTPEDGYRSSAAEREQIEALMELIQEAPWAIVAVNEGKRHTVNFTPRLGRESAEELVSNGVPNSADRFRQDGDGDGELMSQRSPPFAPRLGRRVLPFSPRLGRENDRS